MPNTDDLYAVSLPRGAVMHGTCAEKKWPEGLPEDDETLTPVYYGDTWRAEVAGLCIECGRLVDPEADT